MTARVPRRAAGDATAALGLALAGLLALVSGCSGPGDPTRAAGGSTTGSAHAQPADPAATAGPTGPAPSGTPASPTGSSVPAPPPPGVAPAVELPPAGAAFDYQLGGAYPPPAGVQVVARDSSEAPPAGVYGICYVNGFQTQPGESERWWREHPDLVLAEGGRPVVDEAWPDEYLLDTSTPDKRAAIAALLADVVRGCAAAGYRAVELDNLDSWTRSDGRLTSDGALDLASRLITVAHASGLAVAQKNAAELGERGRQAGFDLVVTEECHRWDECAAYTDVYGEHVLDIEYTDDLRGSWAQVCADPQTPASVVLRDRMLTAPGSAGYAYDRC